MNLVHYTTGEVSKKLHISVRTIRYYDQINLLKPTMIHESGKRLYSEEDLLLLEKITLLKAASLPLKDIKQIIERVSIADILKIHQERLKADMQQLQKSLEHTNTLLNIMKLEGTLRWEELVPLFQQHQTYNKEDVWKEIFSNEERATLTTSLPKLEEDSDTIVKWINLMKRIELCLAEGKSPNSPEGKIIAEDIHILSSTTFANEDLADKFWEVRKSENASEALGLYPISQEILQFIEEASKGISVSTSI
ncbi:MerR family transcriptional regulator [Psychrobacillus sp. INOP01]|nr:MerR family transcriptional regulator [Psychrobacillus sp. INOP01]QUG43386.1 MerR family transcriptional regulator [Psychrobacillus sp. INOP01]